MYSGGSRRRDDNNMRTRADHRVLVLNWVKRRSRKDILPPIFENVAICMACGKEKHVNTCGFCEDCWIQFSHLRDINFGRKRK